MNCFFDRVDFGVKELISCWVETKRRSHVGVAFGRVLEYFRVSEDDFGRRRSSLWRYLRACRHQQYIGRVKHAVFQTQGAGRKRVVVATEYNAIASLNLRTGEICMSFCHPKCYFHHSHKDRWNITYFISLSSVFVDKLCFLLEFFSESLCTQGLSIQMNMENVWKTFKLMLSRERFSTPYFVTMIYIQSCGWRRMWRTLKSNVGFLFNIMCRLEACVWCEGQYRCTWGFYGKM
jgi:hypothetical protein